jgi:hypothetical protein
MRWFATSLVGLLAISAPLRGAGTQASQPSPERVLDRTVLERFLADNPDALVSYQAVRRLSVVARGGKMQATLTAKTSLDPVGGFQFEVLEEEGSGMLRSRVLRGVLEAERDAKRREHGAHGTLSEANYEFVAGGVTPDGLFQIAIHPRRKDTLLIEGNIFLTNDAADLVRLEGLLVKRPSFWTRRVEIVRRYCRIGGVRVPIATGSTADVLFAGKSIFSMDYEYQSINGVAVPR